jgi:hypothetical protein
MDGTNGSSGAAPLVDALTPAEKRRLLARLLGERSAERRARPAVAPLSFSQERLWFLDQLEPGTPLYNIPNAIPLHGRIDTGALARSLREIARRHEILRTTFTAEGGRPVQVIHPALEIEVPVLDRTGLGAAERQGETERIGREEAERPFDLAGGPLLRAVLVSLDQRPGREESVLLLTFHHIVSDGWSLGIFFRELSLLYEAFAAGRPSPLPEPALQYADFARWQRGWLQGETLAALLAYWRAQLAGAPPVLRLPTDFPRPEDQTFAGAMLSFQLPRALADRVVRLGQRHGATLFMTLLAAWLVLLYRYTGEEDLVVGTPIANRNRAELEGLIGFFVNTLVLRVPVAGDESFGALLARVGEVTLAAYDHQDVPFEKLVDELAPGRDLRHTPLCQVVFNLQNAPTWARSEGETPAITPHSGTAKFDLNLTMAETGQGLAGAFEYNTDLFAEPTVRAMRDHLEAVLEAVTADPGIHLLDVPLERGTRAAARAAVDRVDETESFAF